jgi:hypothetical protein
MRAVTLMFWSILLLVGVAFAGIAFLLVVSGWSSSNAEEANGECEMLIIDKSIEPANRATDYRRACMASKGFGMDRYCYVNNYSTASCFIPRWMFWVDKV